MSRPRGTSRPRPSAAGLATDPPRITRAVQPVRDQPDEADLRAVLVAVRRVAAARMSAPADVDDVVQETAVRVWDVRWRLERGALLGYGVAVARNLVTSTERRGELNRRHAPRLTDPERAGDPAAGVLRDEEHAALRSALLALRDDDRRLLVQHEVDGADLAELARRRGTSSGAVAARLARARARLRVQHLLAYRRVRLPTPRCRPVLEALSLGDRSRQRSLDVGGHLVDCEVCADLAEPLIHRDRTLTVLAPFALLLALPAKAWAWARANPLPATGSAVGVGAVAVAVAVAGGSAAPPTAVAAPAAVSPTPVPAAVPSPVPTTLSVGGAAILPSTRVGSLRRYAGRPATGTDVSVQAVPADEGFWVGAGPGRRVWVQLAGPGESPVTVRPGQRVSFTGRVVTTALPPSMGMTAADAAEIRAAGGYLLVDPTSLTVR